MPRTRTYLFALLTVISLTQPLHTHAEESKVAHAESDTIQTFRGIAVSYDIAGTVMRMVGDYGQFEAALRVNIKDRYFPTIELGLGDAKHSAELARDIEAKVSSPYGRIGCDFNMSKNKHDIYRVFVGARYAFTSFKTEANANVTDPYWGSTLPYSIKTKSCFFHWAEFLFAVDAQIWGPIRLGWSFRYRAKLGQSDIGDNNLWYIPGYGKDGNRLGGTFNITVELGRKNRTL